MSVIMGGRAYEGAASGDAEPIVLLRDEQFRSTPITRRMHLKVSHNACGSILRLDLSAVVQAEVAATRNAGRIET